MRTDAAVQVSGIIFSFQVVQSIEYGFSVDIYYSFSRVCSLIEKVLKHIGFMFSYNFLLSASLLRISRVCK